MFPRTELTKSGPDSRSYLMQHKLSREYLPSLAPTPAFRCPYLREIDLSQGMFDRETQPVMSWAMLFVFRPAWEDYTTSSGTYMFPSDWKPTFMFPSDWKPTFMFPSDWKPTFMFPSDWKPTLQGTQSVRMWAECAVRVNSQGFPTDAPLRKVRPIAIQTRSGIYLVRQKVSTVTQGHGYVVRFQAKALHLLGGSEELTRLMSSC